MGVISSVFNFDNIGQKIKSFAKWSCWISILLIWIAAPICFLILVADEYTAWLSWISLVAAGVWPVIVWVNSWVLATRIFLPWTCFSMKKPVPIATKDACWLWTINGGLWRIFSHSTSMPLPNSIPSQTRTIDAKQSCEEMT